MLQNNATGAVKIEKVANAEQVKDSRSNNSANSQEIRDSQVQNVESTRDLRDFGSKMLQIPEKPCKMFVLPK